MLVADCRVLAGLQLHQICAAAASEAINLLAGASSASQRGARAIVGHAAADVTDHHGLGRLFGDPSGQCQYLIDLQDDAVFERFVWLAQMHPRGVGAIRRICRAVATTPGIASVPGVIDAPPISGTDRADEIERHIWIRIAAG